MKCRIGFFVGFAITMIYAATLFWQVIDTSLIHRREGLVGTADFLTTLSLALTFMFCALVTRVFKVEWDKQREKRRAEQSS